MKTIAKMTLREKQRFVLLAKLNVPLEFLYTEQCPYKIHWKMKWRTLPHSENLRPWLLDDPKDNNHAFTCIRRKPKARV